jgi:D-sedoheptulose 7-phosphate isomerase
VKTPSTVSEVPPSCTGFSQIASARQYFQIYQDIVAQLPYSAIDQIVMELLRCYERGAAIFLFGNGGSASLASHFACDLGKGTVIDGDSLRRFRVVALTDNVSLITAWANDSSYERIFAEQLHNLIRPGDVAFAISGSGSSPNILAGLQAAKTAGGTTIGLTGAQGARMKALCDYCVVVPSSNMQIIEDFHLGVAHAVFTVIRCRIAEALQSRVLAKTNAFD